jgi:predicted acyltransferase
MATTAAPSPQAAAPAMVKTGSEERYVALDAFRGFIMIALAAEGFGFGELLDHPTYGGVARWFEHVRWEGGVFWDMVQPSFMFMVGVAMPFALAKRLAQGATPSDNFKHVGSRAIKLILLSHLLMIVSQQRIHFQLINVLSQIAFTYFLTYLILQMRFRWQVAAGAGLLLLHSLLFFLFPGPDGAFSRQGNIGQLIDRALLGYNYPGLYVTINFISSTATTLFGAWTGMLLRGPRPRADKLKILAGAALACFILTPLLSLVIPNVKRIWTATFTFYSTGWVLVMMLGFMLLIDVAGMRKPFFPLLVVGMNSIFIYSCGFLLKGATERFLEPFTGGFRFVGDLAPVAEMCSVLVVFWFLCYWLYRQKIFLKV